MKKSDISLWYENHFKSKSDLYIMNHIETIMNGISTGNLTRLMPNLTTNKYISPQKYFKGIYDILTLARVKEIYENYEYKLYHQVLDLCKQRILGISFNDNQLKIFGYLESQSRYHSDRLLEMNCPNCDHSFTVYHTRYGKDTTCPNCKQEYKFKEYRVK